MTRTHTVYFDDDALAELKAAYQKLSLDLERRRPYISKRIASAMERRLELVRHAWALLLEPVPDALY